MCNASNSAFGVVLGQQDGVVFALDKFRPHLLGFKVIIFSDHAALKYLLKKPDAKPRLIRWMLFLDKKGVDNAVADHLSRIEREPDLMPIRDDFLDEQLLHMDTSTPWFTNICNFIVASQFPPEASWLYKEKIKSDAKYYIWDDPYLWKRSSDQVICKYISDSEISSILHFFHAIAGGGHHKSTQIAQKVLDSKFYWPTIFRDAHQFVLTTSSTDPLYAFDLEIELTLCRLKKIRNIVVNTSSSSDSAINPNLPSPDTLVSSSNIFAQSGQMENNDRTLKELATLDVVYQPWCIQYPQLEPAQTYELKSGLIHLRRPPQASKGIPCGLLHNEAVGDIGGLHQNEGVSILPGWSSKGLAIPSAGTFQHLGRHEVHILGEVLFGIPNCVHQEGDMWDKAAYRRDFARVLGKVQQTLCHLSTPSDQRIYFYEGLSMMDRSMIDAASGGALMDKTAAAARHLISNMESNTQQFGIRGPSQSRMTGELADRIDIIVRQLAVGQHQPALAMKVCGICTLVEHPTDMCPTLQETESDQPENVGAIGGFQYGKKSYQNRPFDSQ
ncbi:hypothetical protein CR513_18767, partial [Mucuna pruriens]